MKITTQSEPTYNLNLTRRELELLTVLLGAYSNNTAVATIRDSQLRHERIVKSTSLNEMEKFLENYDTLRATLLYEN